MQRQNHIKNYIAKNTDPVATPGYLKWILLYYIYRLGGRNTQPQSFNGISYLFDNMPIFDFFGRYKFECTFQDMHRKNFVIKQTQDTYIFNEDYYIDADECFKFTYLVCERVILNVFLNLLKFINYPAVSAILAVIVGYLLGSSK